MRRVWPVAAALLLAAGVALAVPRELEQAADTLTGWAGQAVEGASDVLGTLAPQGCSLGPAGQSEPAGDASSGQHEGASSQDADGIAAPQASMDADTTGTVDVADSAGSGDAATGGGAEAGDAQPPDAGQPANQTRALALLQEAASEFSPRVEGVEGEGVSVSELLDAYTALQTDPAYDYVTGIEYTYLNDAAQESDCTVSAFELRYLLSDEQQASYAQDMQAALDEAVAYAQANGATTQEGLARAAADALLARCTGGSGSDPALFSAYGCLVQGRAVGRGFADAYKLVLDRLGLGCVVVSDTGQDGGTSWDMVRIDGAWYHVDLYWDSRTQDGQTASQLYFLCSDDAMRAGGAVSWEGPAAVPQGYYEGLAGTDPQARLSFAQSLWREMLDRGDASLEGLEKYRLTYGEAMQAFDALDPAWYGYVASRGAVYLRQGASGDGAGGQGADGCIVCSLSAEYRLTADQIAAYPQVVSTGVAQACQDAAGLDSMCDKVAAVHDWLVRNVAYDESDRLASHTAYGLFANGTAVCEGYSQAFKLAMDELGVPCTIVRSEDMAHQWNMVCLDGTWYHVDVTWDDPTPDAGWQDSVSREHFLRGDASMAALGYHGWESEHEAPADWA